MTSTAATCASSEATPATVSSPLTSVPLVGFASETAGGCVSPVLLNVTVVLDHALLPAASVALRADARPDRVLTGSLQMKKIPAAPPQQDR